MSSRHTCSLTAKTTMTPKNRLLLSAVIAFASLANNASAQNGTKANNSTALNDPASWVGSTPPTPGAGLMIVNGTMSSNQTAPLGDDLSVLGINSTAGGTLTIGNTAGKALTIGSSGINFSGTRRINFGNAVTLGSNQTWQLSTGRINVENTLTTGGNTLSIQGGGGSIISFNASNTLGTEVTISTQTFWIQPGAAGEVTVNGVNNTSATFNLFSGTANIASMGNLGGASSIGSGSLNIRGAATLNYTGGNATSDKGMVRDSAGDSTFNVTTAGQTLTMSGNLSYFGGSHTGAWIFGGAGNLTLEGVVQNGSATRVTKNGAGTLTLSNAANTYAGATTITDGVLSVSTIANGSANSSIGASSNAAANLVFDGGTLRYTGANATSNRAFTINAGKTATIDTANNLSFAGATGTATTGALTKTGAGTLTLTGANTYTGTTTISGGALSLGSAGSFANSSDIIVGNAGSSGAVLDLTAKTAAFSIGAGQLLGGGGTVQLASSGTLNVQGTFSPGNSPGLFTFDAGTTVLEGTTLMEIFGTSRATSPSHGTGFYDAVDVVNNGILQFGGTLTLEFSSLFDNNTTFDLFTPESGSSLTSNFTGVTVGGSFYTGLTWNQAGSTWKSSNTAGGQSLEFSSVTGQLVIVPEPGAIALAGIGIAVAAWAARRRA